MLLKEGNYLEDYFEGYKYMFNLLADDESLHVGYQNILSSPISDETAIPSRIKVIDGWNTHPALSERIENATKHKGKDEVLEKVDACELIPKEVFNSVGESREKEIAVGLEPPVSWGKIKPIPWDDYKNWLSEKLKNHKIPQYLQPFVNKGIVSVKLPSDEELANEDVISPFTKENRHLMLEFSQASRDWDTLVEIKQSDDEIRFTYEGKEIDVSSAIERHKAYLETFNSRLEDLDTNIYKYIWKLSEDKSHLHAMYWLMFFSNDGLNALQRLHQAADKIISTTRFYKENGSPIRIKDEILRDISKGFREFMASFDFSTVSSLCGGWDVGEGKTVNQLLQEWQDYLSEDSTSFDGTVNRIEEVWNLLARMFNVSNTDWQGCMVSAYNGLIIPKIKESDSFAEKYNNTESHLPFIGDGSNKSYEYARFSFENYNRDFNSLLSIAYDNLNHYFASLGMEYGHGWSWLQTYPQQMRFQHLCISYKTYVLSIIVGLYRETDGHGQLFVNNKDNENLLRECERYNLTPCIFVVDCADGTPHLSEPYLVDARTHEPLNLAKIAEDNDGIMSDWEIHNIGIQCACEYLKKQGITKISYSDVIGIHPQIWFEKDGKQCYALVRSIPAGLHEQKYEITSGQQNRYSEFKGYFFDVHWNMMLGNNGDFRDKRLFRENNPWNLVHRLELKPIEEAIKEYEFIEIVEGESYDIK